MGQTQFDSNEPFQRFKHKNSKRWPMRFSIKGQGQQRIALGTEDYEDAKRLALTRWNKDTAFAEAGLSVKRKKFNAIADEFIEEIEFAVARGEKEPYHKRQFPPIVRRYFVGFFGKFKFTAITTADIEDYWRWRINYWTTGEGSKDAYVRYDRTINGRTTKNIKRPVKEGVPSNSTLSKEALLLKQLFVFGQRRGYTLEIPQVRVLKSLKRRITDKPGFTLEKFQHLESVSIKRVQEYEDQKNYERLYYDRLKLHCYCMIAGYTGMRPTELKNLSWGDIGERPIELTNGQTWNATIIQTHGKAKDRELAPQPECLTYLNQMRNIFLLQVKREPIDDDPVFINNDGKRMGSFKKSLAELLIAANLREQNGKLRDSGSFRPFYISQQIREGVHTQLIIRNVGTSEAMVNKHYNKIRPTEEIAKLTPDWHKRRMKSIKPKD